MTGDSSIPHGSPAANADKSRMNAMTVQQVRADRCERAPLHNTVVRQVMAAA